tara:strand:- start:507 stop:1331 length:825 start_codon:yes stop_codon:yes gene_type:complete
MLSKHSLNFLTKKNKSKYNKFMKSPNKRDFINLIKQGVLPRPHYALGALFAAHQATFFGYKKFTLIEFGCWNNEGLIDLDHWCSIIKKLYNIDYQIYGFDSGKGLPESNHNKDVKYKWSSNDFAVNKFYSIKKLNNVKLIVGNVKNTINDFIKKNFSQEPIGFISFDMDYFTSTSQSFKIFKSQQKNFIPRPILYFDDFILTSEFEGEYLAINNFNSKNKNNKISSIGELAEQMSIYWNKWIFLAKRLKIFTNFKHKLYLKRYENLIYKEIISK